MYFPKPAQPAKKYASIYFCCYVVYYHGVNSAKVIRLIYRFMDVVG